MLYTGQLVASYNYPIDFVYKNSTQTEGFRKLVEYSIQNKIRTTFKAAVPLGAWESNLDQLITDSDRNTLFDLHREYPFLVRTCIATPNSTCPGFNKIITVTAFGDILPCNAIHVSFGNIRKKNLEVTKLS